MAGYQLILALRDLEKQCDELGLMMCYPKHRYDQGDSDEVAVKPKDADSLPIYARDAELFVGSLYHLRVWIRGIKWARQYDEMLKLTNDDKRKRKEQDERNRQLVSTIRNNEADKKAKANLIK
jgi:hypothetical protein